MPRVLIVTEGRLIRQALSPKQNAFPFAVSVILRTMTED